MAFCALRSIILERRLFVTWIMTDHKAGLAREIALSDKDSLGAVLSVLDALPELAFLMTENGQYLEVFGAQDTLIVTEAHNLIGKTVYDVMPKENADQILSVIKDTVRLQTNQIVEYELDVLEGRRLFEGRVAPLTLTDKINHIVWFARDITDERKREKELEFMAYHDCLTRLPNRTALYERLEEEKSRCERHVKISALLFIDLDNFKIINDQHSHAFGDSLLKYVAIQLRNQVRSEDFVARIGGDEFIVLLSMIDTDPQKAIEDAKAKALEILDSIESIKMIEGMPVKVSASIGISVITDQTDCSETALKQADKAMYLSKSAGRAQVSEFLSATVKL